MLGNKNQNVKQSMYSKLMKRLRKRFHAWAAGEVVKK